MRFRDAFTLLELVFVIVIMGILAALSIPQFDSGKRQEAIDAVLSAVRYTQFLALTDSKHRVGVATWQKAYWAIQFDQNGSYYRIFSNVDLSSNVDKNESAIDPTNGKLFYTNDDNIDTNESVNIFLNRRFGIDRVDFSECQSLTGDGTNTSRLIAFDAMGRPHKGVFSTSNAVNTYATLVVDDCNITFGFANGEDDFTLHIESETGYAYVVGQEDL